MSSIHLEVLNKKQLAVFNRLASFAEDGYLAGGTALALQINHRRSYDFDVFVNQAINARLQQKIRNIFDIKKLLIDSEDQMTFLTSEFVQLTFLWYYFKTIKPLIPTDPIPLASIADIAADKARTIGRRAIWRDYVDVFWILKHNLLSMEDVITHAQNKFKEEFSETLFLQQLVYFDDLTISPIEFAGVKYKDKEIRKFLTEKVKKYTLARIG